MEIQNGTTLRGLVVSRMEGTEERGTLLWYICIIFHFGNNVIMNLKIKKINLDKETNSDIAYKQKQKNSIFILKGKIRPNLSVKHNIFLYILRLKPQITITSNGSLVRS